MGADLYLGKSYFRDSYNSSSIIRAFGLSWWRDIIPKLKDGYITPAFAEWLRVEMDRRLDRFQINTAGLSKQDQVWLRAKYARFCKFLNRCIRKDLPITASL